MKNDTGNYKVLCYLGIFILLLFIILPPLFRVLFPAEEEVINNEEENLPLIMKLSCTKDDDYTDYMITTSIETNYHEEKIHDATIKYEIKSIGGALPEEQIRIEDYENLKKVDNVYFEEDTDNNTYILKIDFDKFDYSDEELLLNYKNVLAEQYDYYTSNQYTCTTSRVQ